MAKTTTKVGVNTDPFIEEPATEKTLQSIAGFNIPNNDYIGATYPDAVTEVYTYRLGGASGVIVGVVTVVYQDSTKAVLLNVTKS